MAHPPTRAPGPFRPTRLGSWEVIAKIAGGGMSAVYLGRRIDPTGLEAQDGPRVVALKIVRHDVRMDEAMLRMFLEEGKLIARLDHPNIVRTLEVGGDADQDFIAMELMLGKTFAAIHDAVAARDIRLNAEIAAWAAARVADALHYAHELADEHGKPLALVHRDVNPANVFATFRGEVKLFDFGLAKVTAGEATESQLLAGKLSYLSPEQIMQMPLDRRSDIFSLGTTLWELLTGKRLFRRDSDLETVRAVQLGPIPDPRAVAPDIPGELARIAKIALERNREHRYPCAAHLARDLDAFVLSRTSPAEITARLAQLVDTLFPGEHKRQSGWLKPAVGSGMMARVSAAPPNASSAPPTRPPGSPSGRPPPVRSQPPREITQVMPNAPPRPPSNTGSVAPPPPAPPSSRPSAPVSSGPDSRPTVPASSPSTPPPISTGSTRTRASRPTASPPESSPPETVTVAPPSVSPDTMPVKAVIDEAPSRPASPPPGADAPAAVHPAPLLRPGGGALVGALGGFVRPKRAPIPLPSRLRDGPPKKPSPTAPPAAPTAAPPPDSDTQRDVPAAPAKRS